MVAEELTQNPLQINQIALGDMSDSSEEIFEPSMQRNSLRKTGISHLWRNSPQNGGTSISNDIQLSGDADDTLSSIPANTAQVDANICVNRSLFVDAFNCGQFNNRASDFSQCTETSLTEEDFKSTSFNASSSGTLPATFRQATKARILRRASDMNFSLSANNCKLCLN